MCAGTPELYEYNTSELVQYVTETYKLNNKQASEIVAYFTQEMLQRYQKWINNRRRQQKNDAEEIYRLIKRAKKGYFPALDEISRIVTRMCVEG
jgi:vacuolar-type H+-ATPase subunit H